MTIQSATIAVAITAEDFGYLCEESLPWKPGAAGTIGMDRFEGDQPSRDWKHIYWLGQNYAAVVLARAFLAANGYECQMLFDAAEHPNGQSLGWVLLTDYQHDRWCQSLST
jgi:hypothetical protein